ncbi:hypothetical protein [Haloglomus litoreum]|uniref:hypothetical protein n=1 Tax=Haloglomus litoreum TaxID=3034026 RepID=UPI0023E7F111|nr:hypothetical protein [Haloglomus sp. DT116]
MVSTTDLPGRRWEVVRVGLGVMYLLGALAHVALGWFAPEIYASFADRAPLGAYTDLWRALVVPNLFILQPLVAVFELGVGVALLWRGRAVLVGHAVGASFQAVLILSGPWGPVNAVLALVHLAALRTSYPATVAALARWRVGRAS